MIWWDWWWSKELRMSYCWCNLIPRAFRLWSLFLATVQIYILYHWCHCHQLQNYNAGCSLGIGDQRILLLLHRSLFLTFHSLWLLIFFFSDVEPLSKYSPVTLHLSPATRILNENPANVFLIWSMLADYTELAREIESVRNREIFWMNHKVIDMGFQHSPSSAVTLYSCCYRHFKGP